MYSFIFFFSFLFHEPSLCRQTCTNVCGYEIIDQVHQIAETSGSLKFQFRLIRFVVLCSFAISRKTNRIKSISNELHWVAIIFNEIREIYDQWKNRMKRQTTEGRTKRLFRKEEERGGNNEDRKDGFCKGWKRLGGMNGAFMARISMREKIHRVSPESCQLMNIYEHPGFIYRSKSWKIISNFW